MPPRKQRSPTRRPTKAATAALQEKKKAKAAGTRRAKTQALAVAEAVRREPVGAQFSGPLAAFEPLRRSVIDRQIALLGIAMSWSPAHIIVSQQAAFWEGFVHDSAKAGARVRKPARKNAKRGARA